MRRSLRIIPVFQAATENVFNYTDYNKAEQQKMALLEDSAGKAEIGTGTDSRIKSYYNPRLRQKYGCRKASVDPGQVNVCRRNSLLLVLQLQGMPFATGCKGTLESISAKYFQTILGKELEMQSHFSFQSCNGNKSPETKNKIIGYKLPVNGSFHYFLLFLSNLAARRAAFDIIRKL